MVGLAIGVIPGGKLIGRVAGDLRRVGSFLGHIGTSAVSTAAHYARRFTSWLTNKLSGLASRARELLGRCGCFTAGTEVWTRSGRVPIEKVEVGDQVLAYDESSGQESFRVVTRKFVRKAAPIVAVVLSLSNGHAAVLNTTEEHPFYSECAGWVAAGALQAGTEITSLDGLAVVQGVAFTGELATVYNLEVEGLHDYRVGPDGVLVHNLSDRCWLWPKHHLIPLYMAGKKAGTRVELYLRDHQLLHQLIDEARHSGNAPFQRGSGRARTLA
jgi:hypothetical protein